MVQVLLLFALTQLFAQDREAVIIREGQEYAQQLSEQKVRTEESRQRLIKAETDLRNYQGTDDQEKKRLEQSVSIARSNVDFAIKGERDLERMLKMNGIEKNELSQLPQYKQFINCDAQTPELNLEESGAFKNIPRDNQDGLGTCYANVAKNLLIALSEGKDVASFTDLALQYKSHDARDLARSGLDGGDSCEVLDAVKEKGYCPQTLSPLETGEKNELTELLFKQRSLEDLGSNIDSLKGYLSGVNKEINPSILGEARSVIEEVKKNPDIILPLPVARFNIMEPADSVLRKDLRLISYRKGFQEKYNQFYSKMMKGLLAGQKPEAIFGYFQEIFSPEFERYGWEKKLEALRSDFIQRTRRDFKDKNLRSNLRTSLDFLKKVAGQSEMSDENFADYCRGEGMEAVKFLETMSPILAQVKKGRLKTENLLGQNGEVKEGKDLIQLMVAPSCLNQNNRRMMDYPFTCQAKSLRSIRDLKDPKKEIVAFRTKIVMSLAQGLPLGNSFDYGDGSHINTIVGLRFNPKKNQCEYLIRESQTGRSTWQQEDGIYKKINRLTEIRRQ